ncbi:MAG TPA: DUF2530 domain-containing protein [Streptosporangiaceae bacterium]|nr:DUF2530 domain-containing protein [Streptosporangiaceae bacterium]
MTRTVHPPPPPLEANDQFVTAIITAGWAVALVVLLVLRDQIAPDERWWVWTCAAGLAMGLFGLWYVPRVKRARARAASRRAQAQGPGA